MYINRDTGEELCDEDYNQALYSGERSIDDFEEMPVVLIGRLEILVDDLEAIISQLREQLENGDFIEGPDERDDVIDKLAVLTRLH